MSKTFVKREFFSEINIHESGLNALISAKAIEFKAYVESMGEIKEWLSLPASRFAPMYHEIKDLSNVVEKTVLIDTTIIERYKKLKEDLIKGNSTIPLLERDLEELYQGLNVVYKTLISFQQRLVILELENKKLQESTTKKEELTTPPEEIVEEEEKDYSGLDKKSDRSETRIMLDFNKKLRKSDIDMLKPPTTIAEEELEAFEEKESFSFFREGKQQ